MSRLTLDDFSGGLTDTPYSSEVRCFDVMDNVLIGKDRTAVGAPGADMLLSGTSRVPSGKRISKLSRIDEDTLIAFSGRHAYAITGNVITEILGPSGNLPFSAGTDNSIPAVETFTGQLAVTNDAHAYPIKFYKDGDGVVQVRTAGLPAPLNAPVIDAAAGANNYVYAFAYSYSYRVGSVLHRDVSAPIYVPVAAADTPIDIGPFPAFTNGSDFNWDTANVSMDIYRTTNNGVTFYLVATVENMSDTITDTYADDVLMLGTTLYTTGGITPNEMPPRSKVVFEANDTAYYLDVIQSNERIPYKGLQSQTNDFDSVPGDYSYALKGTLVGGGSVGRNAIIFTDGTTVRLDGILDETGKGVIAREVLSSTVGCIAHNSIVKTANGLMWAAADGFYYTNGYSAPTKLARRPGGSKIDRLYKELVLTQEQRGRIQGAYDSKNNRVYWTVQRSEADNELIYVYDEAFDAFTTLSNEVGILPTALLMDGEDLIVGDSHGYLFRYSSESYNHPDKQVGVDPSTWVESTVMYRIRSVHLTMGDASTNKWITKINVQGNPETNINMGIRSYTNGEQEWKELYPLRLIPGLTWGDPAFTWGDDAFLWNKTTTLNQTRSFPTGRLRARQRQVEFTNAYYTVLSSTELPASYVTINAGAKTATLVTPSAYSFGLNNELYDLVIGVHTYRVVSGTEDTLVVLDPAGTLVSGATAWKIKGYGKGQRMHLLNFSVDYEPMSDAGTFWRGSEEA